MAINITPLILPQLLTVTVDTYYTSTNVKTRIDKLTVTNVDVAPHTVTIHLVSPSAPVADNNKITMRSILPGETWNCPDLVGQVMPSGGTIRMSSDLANTLIVSAAGTQVS